MSMFYSLVFMFRDFIYQSKRTNFDNNTDLEFVSDADEAEFARLLFGIPVGD